MNRREFVKYLTAGTAGQFILSNNTALAVTPLNVVIVGGGMAGATAAKYLRVWAKKAGLDTAVNVTLIDKNSTYVSNIMSNMVLTGEKTLASLTYNYTALKTKYGINFITAEVTSIDTGAGNVYGRLNNIGSPIKLNATPYSKLILAGGIGFDYSTFTLTVPSNVYPTASDAIPHAWQAGAQTTLLLNQLKALKAGNHVVMTIPPSPYRCPPGPYERACVIADWLRAKKPGSKLFLLDAGQTVSGKPSVEPTNFGYAFSTIHTNLVYIQNAKLTAVVASNSGSVKLKTLSFERMSNDPINSINALGSNASLNSMTLGNSLSLVAEVANVIPKMRASDLVRSVVTDANLDGGWAKIDEKSYKSTGFDNVYVIGDSIKSANQPKAGHIGNQEAKVCADAILREYSNISLYDTPVTNSACFTPVTTSLNKTYGARASWLTASFKYGEDTDHNFRMLKISTNIESPGTPSKDNFDAMNKWFASLMQDVYA